MSGYVNHIVVCGYEMGSGMLLDVLSSEIDTEEQRVVLFGPYERPRELWPEFLWVQGDPTKESELDKARITHASTVIVTGSRRVVPQEADAVTILTVFTIRSALTKAQPPNPERCLCASLRRFSIPRMCSMLGPREAMRWSRLAASATRYLPTRSSTRVSPTRRAGWCSPETRISMWGRFQRRRRCLLDSTS